MPIKTSIAFGLIYIPVTLAPAVKNTDVGFNMLHKKTLQRVKYVKTVPDIGEIKSADIVKGYEYDKGKYVVFSEDDFEKLKSEKDKNIEITKFVNKGDIDRVYYDKAYYIVPSGGEKAYALLARAMEDSGLCGIAKSVFGNKETLIALFAEKGRLSLSTLHYADEIAANTSPVAGDVGENELKLAQTLIDSMTGTFNAEEYKDGYRERLYKAIESKIEGKEIEGAASFSAQKAVDLMEALKLSVEAAEKNVKENQPEKKTAKSKERKRA